MATNPLRLPAYITGGDSSASFNGPWIDIGDIASISFEFKSTAANGTISFEGSNDGGDSTTGGPKPVVLGAAAVPTPTGSTNPAGAAFVGVALFTASIMPPMRWLRLKFVRSAGGAASDVSVGVYGYGI